MMKTYRTLCILALVVTAGLLASCASDMTQQYEAYTAEVRAYNTALNEQQTLRTTALASVLESDSETAQIVAAIMLGMGPGNGGGAQPLMLQPPTPQRDGFDRFLQVLSIAAPIGLQLGIEHQRTDQIRYTTAAQAQMHGATMGTFATFAGSIQAPQANVSTATTHTTTNTSTIQDSYNPITNTTDSTHTPTVVIPPAGP